MRAGESGPVKFPRQLEIISAYIVYIETPDLLKTGVSTIVSNVTYIPLDSKTLP